MYKKNSDFLWGPAQQGAFKALKAALVQAPILGYPDQGIGAVLFQVSEGARREVIAYYSRVLNSAERNYDTRERECLAAIEAKTRKISEVVSNFD
ncbi:hypothetical protein Pelo_8805 [Pelomyxa schiedti]|nr:hypothetical protein Pelo_8805 [Pelomyxa schiedti]